MTHKQGIRRRSYEALGWDAGGPSSSIRANAGTVRAKSDRLALRFEAFAEEGGGIEMSNELRRVCISAPA